MRLEITFDSNISKKSIIQYVGMLRASGMYAVEAPDDNLDDAHQLIKVNTYSTRDTSREGNHFVNPIDMKPFLARSPQATVKKNGDWSITVPLVHSNKSLLNPAMQSNKDWLNNLHTGDTVSPDDLAKHINPADYSNDEFNSLPTASEKQPFAYRTVNENSPANSWITENIVKDARQEQTGDPSVKKIHIQGPWEDNFDSHKSDAENVQDWYSPSQKSYMTNHTRNDLNYQSFDTGYTPNQTIDDVLNNAENDNSIESDRSTPEKTRDPIQLSLFDPPTR